MGSNARFPLFAQCVLPADVVVSPDETNAWLLVNRVIADIPVCATAGAPGCAARHAELMQLSQSADRLALADSLCVQQGKDSAGSALATDQKSKIGEHGQFWMTVRSAISADLNGTAVLPPAIVDKFFNTQPLPSAVSAVIPDPAKPALGQQLREAMQTFRINGQSKDLKTYPTATSVQICIFEAQNTTDGDCTKVGSALAPSNILDPKTNASVGSVNLGDDGNATVTLAKPLALGQEVFIVQTVSDANGVLRKMVSVRNDVLVANQCNKDFKKTPFSDCDWNFTIIGGVEQAGLASEPSTTNGFLRAFTRQSLHKDKYLAWASIRLLSAPQQASSNGIISQFTDPTGATVTQSVSSVGTAIDYFLGLEAAPWVKRNNVYTISLIAGAGATTPLFANTVTEAYKAPAFGTVECLEFQNRFLANPNTTFLAAHNIAAGTGTDATPVTGTTGIASCLVNRNSVTTTNGVATYSPINTIGFSNQDRTAFLGKWFLGIRTIDRFRPKGIKACGDSDPANSVGPCSRGVVDFLFGADASINRGVFRPWVFKVDAVHPLLIKDTSYLYLFGSFSVRLAGNINYNPLILQTSDPAALNNGGASPVPNVNVVVLPLTVPARDFYRFGFGVDVSCILTKLFNSSSGCSGFPAAAKQ